jgi:uncharacterized protein
VTLAEAVREGDVGRIRELVAEGADVNARVDGVPMLEWALLNQSVAAMDVLLELGADPAQADDDGATVVHLAAMANDPAFLTVLLTRGVDPNIRHTATGDPPMVSALMGDRAAQFQALLAAGADPNATDRMRNTPLHHAAKINAHREVLALLEAGADPLATTAQGATFQRYLFMTPTRLLHEQARKERAAIIDWLRSHDIPVEETA